MLASENYLLVKSAEKLGTPVKMELDKLRLVAEERASNCNKGLASVLGIANASSPLAEMRSDAFGVLPSSPMVTFKPGMSVYRPGCGVAKTDHCPPTPGAIQDGKRSRMENNNDDENRGNDVNVNLKDRFVEALNANTIPFSPARASAQGINLNERETCPKKLASRQKQIDYGKNTTGYSLYTDQVPRFQRVRGDHPWTPNKFQICSKRSWDGQVRKWRRALHRFDPSSDSIQDENEDTSDSIDSSESASCTNEQVE